MKKSTSVFLLLACSSAYAYANQESEINQSTAAMQNLASQIHDIKRQAAGELAADAPKTRSSNPAAVMQVKKYGIMKRNGASLSELCMQSMMIKNIFLNQGNEADYRSWNKVSTTNCSMSNANPSM